MKNKVLVGQVTKMYYCSWTAEHLIRWYYFNTQLNTLVENTENFQFNIMCVYPQLINPPLFICQKD